MQEVRWRKGVLGAKGPERIVLLEAKKIAEERAFGEAYHERCEQQNSILCDATDLAVRSSSVEWARFRGDLLIVITVYHRSAGRVRTFRWRGSVSKAIGKAFGSYIKRGLKNRDQPVP